MSPPRLFALLLLCWVGITGCDASSPAGGVSARGAMRLSLTTPLAAPGNVTRVTVTVSGADMAPSATDLVPTQGTWGGVLGDIPAGERRVFQARAFNASGTPLYEGRVEDVTVLADATGLLVLVLQDLLAPAPFLNEAPIVDALLVTPTTVRPGAAVWLNVNARDPNAGDTLGYTWTAPSGRFSSPTQAGTYWTSPSQQGVVLLSLRVNDSHGATLTVNVPVNVSAGTGAQEVRVDFVSPPRLTALTSTQSSLTAGQSTALSVSASGLDGEVLRYQWSATCSGYFTQGTSASATFTATVPPTTACNNCQVTVAVTDGRGARNQGSLALCVKSAPPPVPPSVTRTYQSGRTVKASQSLFFEVEAKDSTGSALTFNWKSDVSASLGYTGGGPSSRLTWTAPACGGYPQPQPFTVTATITNALGAKSTETFSATLEACVPASWRPAVMNYAREGHDAVVLPDGRVLVAGNRTTPAAFMVEVYDPARGTWTFTDNLNPGRSSHRLTLLANGKVLVTGGQNAYDGTYLSRAEVYDPATGQWLVTGSMYTARAFHTTTLLPDGRVLVTGGKNSSGHLASTEVYNPSTGNWDVLRAPWYPRSSHTATLLGSGQVLVAGGASDNPWLTEEVFDLARGEWSRIGNMAYGRVQYSAVPLSNGKVLAAAGSTTTKDVDLYDPATGKWTLTGALSEARALCPAVRLADGRVLLSGGTGSTSTGKATAEVYDPATGVWTPTASMYGGARSAHTATLLPDGRVLVTGGRGSDGFALRTAELYEPGTPP